MQAIFQSNVSWISASLLANRFYSDALTLTKCFQNEWQPHKNKMTHSLHSKPTNNVYSSSLLVMKPQTYCRNELNGSLERVQALVW